MDTDTDSLLNVAVLMQDLKSDYLNLRVEAIKKLGVIATTLGPQRTREELVPFLVELTDDEDEVLLSLAEVLSHFEDYVGGTAFAHVLFQPLEPLASADENAVREKATEAMVNISRSLSPSQVDEALVPLIQRLTESPWFSSRASAAILFPEAYPKVNDATKTKLRRSFEALCKDSNPPVRRAAASHLPKLIKKLSKEHLISEIVPLFKTISADEQDSVRLLTVNSLVSLAEEFTPAETSNYLLTSIRALTSDHSWRVRYMVADQFIKLSQGVGADITRDELINVFVSLLKDSEAEVRTAAAGKVQGFGALINPDTLLRQILPCVKDLTSDASEHVRASLAMQISGLGPLLGRDNTIEHLLPHFFHLLKDEFPEVRLNIISKLAEVNEVIGINLLSQSLLPAIIQLSEDKRWRVRLAIIEYMPLLARQLGVSFFDEKLANLCMFWLGDPVFSIREAATTNLRNLAEVFGPEWAKSTVIPKVLGLSSHANYFFRMTTAFAISAISTVVTPEVIRTLMVPVLAGPLSQDPVPNIRFNVAKSIETILPLLLHNPQDPEAVASVETQIRPALDRLSQDTDGDVRFFSSKALQTVDKLLAK